MPWYKPTRNWGHLVAGIWFIGYGVLALVPKLSFDGSGTVLAVVAIIAGVLLVLGR
jgi:hypothetical protein